MAAKSREGCIIKVWIYCQNKSSAATHRNLVGIYWGEHISLVFLHLPFLGTLSVGLHSWNQRVWKCATWQLLVLYGSYYIILGLNIVVLCDYIVFMAYIHHQRATHFQLFCKGRNFIRYAWIWIVLVSKAELVNVQQCISARLDKNFKHGNCWLQSWLPRIGTCVCL